MPLTRPSWQRSIRLLDWVWIPVLRRGRCQGEVGGKLGTLLNR